MKEKNNDQPFIPQTIVKDSKSNGSSAKYICPMHCEEDKTYDEPGSCPVCNMHLKPVSEVEGEPHQMSHNTGDKHQNHEHHVDERNSQTGDTGDYYCPMQCEGDKSYKEPGDCPECGMHLIKKVTAGLSHKTKYTCPMHPEIIKETSGSCDICQMPLVTTESQGYVSDDPTLVEKPLVIPVTAAQPSSINGCTVRSSRAGLMSQTFTKLS